MGKLLSKIFGNKEMRILMLGLDAAGKTSILYNFQAYNINETPSSVLVQPGLCWTCSETTLLVFPRGGSNVKIMSKLLLTEKNTVT